MEKKNASTSSIPVYDGRRKYIFFDKAKTCFILMDLARNNFRQNMN